MNVGLGLAGTVSTIDESEIEFWNAKTAPMWWDLHGPLRWLHKYNAVRIPYIRDAVCRRFRRDQTRRDCLHGLRVLDIGCGGGLLSEPLACLGATIVGIDPAENAIKAARLHARAAGVDIDYRCASIQGLVEAAERFDAVVAMEVVEHVADSRLFLQKCAEVVQAPGLLLLSTINRTFKSFAFAIVCGEYLLGLLPRGTHQWNRFVRPEEIAAAVEPSGMKVIDVTGVNMNAFSWTLRPSTDAGVNYLLTAERPS